MALRAAHPRSLRASKASGRLAPGAAALALALAACARPDHARQPPAARQDRQAPIPVLAVAWESMPTLREEARSAAPPMALTASDGSGLRLVSLEARAVVEGPLAMTELHLVFDNPEPRVREGTFSVTLPPSASVSRFAMRGDAGWLEGEVVERQLARRAYEDALHRRQDPALLEKQPGNEFRARVFPIPPQGRKELIVAYAQERPSPAEPYRLQLQGLPALDDLSLRLIVDKADADSASAPRAYEFSRSSFAPDRDFVVTFPPRAAPDALRAGRFAVARVAAPVASAPEGFDRLAVLVDTSASRLLGLPAQLDALRELLAQLRRLHGDSLRLSVAAFDQSFFPVFSGPIADFGEAHLERLRKRGALGASDLAQALRQAASLPERPRRLVLLSDGVATVGTRGDERAALDALRSAGVERIDTIAVGGLRDDDALGRLAASLPRPGVRVPPSAQPAEAARRLGLAPAPPLRVRVPECVWNYPTELRGLLPGDQALVFAELPDHARLAVELNGEARSPGAAAASPPLLERAAARAHIELLTAQREALPPEAAEREPLRQKIIELSTHHRVLSDFTSLLVLETDADYARYKIDRNALTDILTVGTRGVELLQRLPQAAPASSWKNPPRSPINADRPTTPPSPGPAASAAPPDPFALRAPPPPPPGAANAPPSPPAVEPPPPPPPPPPPGAPGSPGDRDGDGVPDSSDACPDVPGTTDPNPSASGCPRRAMIMGREISLNEMVQFDAGKASLGPEAMPLLREIAAILKDHPEIAQISVEGHTDNRESPDLAGVRAAAVVRWLTDKKKGGVDPKRVKPSSFGRTKPIADNATDEGRQKNRRVEIKILRLAGDRSRSRDPLRSPPPQEPPPKPRPAPPYSGLFAEVMEPLSKNKPAEALAAAEAYHQGSPADPLSLVALVEAHEALGHHDEAARAAGSLLDLFPGRADMRRFAANLLERIALRSATAAGAEALRLALDSYREALEQRPDHPSSYRLLAFALLKAGKPADAFAILERERIAVFPPGRFAGYKRILDDDLGLVAAAWRKAAPEQAEAIDKALSASGLTRAIEPSLRFVLSWETDANDVDFHIYDGKDGHAFFQQKRLPSGGELYADVTTGYGPECFAIPGSQRAYPYQLRAHYYSRGPMGYGMGKLEIIEHDGQGKLSFDERPFVVMNDGAMVEMGEVKGSLLQPKR